MANADKGAKVLDARRVERKRLPVVWLDRAELDITANYLIKGLVERGKFLVIYGPSGDGKTFFTADVGAHIAAGIAWRGRRVKQGLVVYVAAEAGASIVRRFFAWRENKLGEAREGKIPLAIVTRGVNLLDIGEVNDLLEELQLIAGEAGLPLAAVIFDTLSRSMPGGDENSSQHLTRVIAAADRIRDELGAGTIIVHHTGKDKERGARGHSSLCAAADTVINVTDRVATIEKVRDGKTGECFAFDLEVVELGTDEDGDVVTTCVVKPTDTVTTRKKGALTGVPKIGLQALQEAIDEQGEFMPSTSTIPAGVKAVTLECWRQRFQLRYGTDRSGEKRDQEAIGRAFRRAKEQLLGDTRIAISDPYVWQT